MSGTILYDSALQQVLEGPEGPVAVDLQRRITNVANQQRLNLTGITVEGARNPEGRGPRVRTGRLRSSVQTRMGRDERGLFAEAGSTVPYGLPLELGLRNGYTYPWALPALPAAAI